MRNRVTSKRKTAWRAGWVVLLAAIPACQSAGGPRPRPRPLQGLESYLAYRPIYGSRPNYGPQPLPPLTLGSYAGHNYGNFGQPVPVIPRPVSPPSNPYLD